MSRGVSDHIEALALMGLETAKAGPLWRDSARARVFFFFPPPMYTNHTTRARWVTTVSLVDIARACSRISRDTPRHTVSTLVYIAGQLGPSQLTGALGVQSGSASANYRPSRTVKVDLTATYTYDSTPAARAIAAACPSFCHLPDPARSQACHWVGLVTVSVV
jgi:hypothetical protein